ncbi:MAG: hypothetical protein PHP74_03775 [Candidatus Gracilibacteria bacterium]|nr:hypothetical protein [Candidatus Gracilibacteria bacterium]
MKSSKLPVVGKIQRSLNALVVNFVLLAVICLILAIVIPMYPEIFHFLISALLLVTVVILLNLARHIYLAKKKYFDWMK